MMLRLKIWPSPELSKGVFVVDGKVLEFRTTEIDLRTFAGVTKLTEYGRSLLWDDFHAVDPLAWDRRADLTTANIEAFSDDTVALNEWVSQLFRESIANLNREWTQAINPAAELQAQAHQREIDRLALEWDPAVVQFIEPAQADDPGF